MKQENVFKIGIIVVAVLATSGVVGFLLTQRAQEAVVEPTVQKTTTPIAQTPQTQVVEKKSLPVKNELLQDAVSIISSEYDKISFNLPLNWGNLVVPKLKNGEFLPTIPLERGFEYVQTKDGTAEGQFQKIISNYTNGNKESFAVVSLAKYQENFIDDSKIDPDVLQGMTAKEKRESFQPVLDIFQQRGLGAKSLNQKCFAIRAVDGSNDYDCQNLRGFWWGNGSAISDRVGIHYLENAEGTLRGIGYFEIEGQEIPDTINAYKIILINPDKKIMVYAYLPLEKIYSFGLGDLSNEKNFKEAPLKIKKAYDYLENPENYKDQKLGQFLKEVEAMISSVKIVAQ
jgi:hypothetical protein